MKAFIGKCILLLIILASFVLGVAYIIMYIKKEMGHEAIFLTVGFLGVCFLSIRNFIIIFTSKDVGKKA